MQGRQSGEFKELIDPGPEIDGLRFIDEVCASGDAVGLQQRAFSLQVCGGDVFNVGDRDNIGAIADLSQSATAGGLQQSGDQVIIAWSPDQMRAQ